MRDASALRCRRQERRPPSFHSRVVFLSFPIPAALFFHFYRSIPNLNSCFFRKFFTVIIIQYSILYERIDVQTILPAALFTCCYPGSFQVTLGKDRVTFYTPFCEVFYLIHVSSLVSSREVVFVPAGHDKR